MSRRIPAGIGITVATFVGSSIAFALPASANASVNCSANSVVDINTCIANANSGANQDIVLTLNNDMVSAGDITALDLPASSTMLIDGNAKSITLSGHKGFDLQAATGQTLTVNNLTLTGGSTATNGGAIFVRRGNFSANNLTIKNSSATGYGGGFAHQDPDATSTISRSSFSGNTSGQFGGGIWTSGRLILKNSTVYGNTAGAVGGVMASATSIAGTSSLQFSTISGNSAMVESSNVGNFSLNNNLILIGTVVSNPLGSIATNCARTALSASYAVVGNASGNDTSCGAAGATQIQLVTTTALDLAAFNSSTNALVPADSSPLVNAAPSDLGTGITTDQRGSTRSGSFTIGAIQVALAAFSPSATSVDVGSITPGSTSAASTVTITNTGSDTLSFGAGAVQLAGANSSEFSIGSNTCSSSSVTIGATCAVSVTFSPASTGSKQATLTFTDNGINSPQAISLSGSGTASGGGGGGGGGGGSSSESTTPAPTASPAATATPSATPTPTPAATPAKKTVSAVLAFQRGTTRLTSLSRIRLVSLLAAVPSGATQINVRVTGVSSHVDPNRTELIANRQRAAAVTAALRSGGLKGAYDSVARMPRLSYRDLAGKVAVSITFLA